MRRRIALGCLAVGAVLAAPAPAFALAPACTPDQFTATDAQTYAGMAFKYTPRFPEQVTAGRPTPIQINTAYGLESEPITATVIRQDGQALAHPFTHDYPVATDTNKAIQTIPLTLEASDGLAAIQVSFTFSYAADSYCRATVVSQWIGTSEPELSLRGGVRRVHDIYKNKGRTQGVLLPLNTTRCGPQVAKLTVTFRGRTISRSTTNLCTWVPAGSTITSSTGLRVRNLGTEGLQIWVKRNGVFSGKVTYRLTYAGQEVTSGSFIASGRRHSAPPYFYQRVTKIT